MRRREFLGVLGGAAAAWPLAVNAQPTAIRTIGWLSLRSSDTEREARSLAAFREGLAQTGYVEGRNCRSNCAMATDNMIVCRRLRPI